MSVPSVSTIRMGMARLLASCRAKMICMGLGDDIALPLGRKMEPRARVAEPHVPCTLQPPGMMPCVRIACRSVTAHCVITVRPVGAGCIFVFGTNGDIAGCESPPAERLHHHGAPHPAGRHEATTRISRHMYATA